MRAEWYWRRLRAMSAGEVATRAGHAARRQAWRRRQVNRHQLDGLGPVEGERRDRSFSSPLPPGAAGEVPDAARRALVVTADELLAGRWEVFGVIRHDLIAPDWFLDPVTGRRAPQDRYAFSIDHRSEETVGNVKQVWELSRHHHLTVLAAAWSLTGDAHYAEAVDRQLRSWWRENPFLSGVHWTSGIELGIRLISWAWVRRLLDGWPGAEALFEGGELSVRQIRWHQHYLAAFRSRGSSANNHVIAEAAGQLVASCAFPWFAESERWRTDAARLLETELERNTFPSGLNREQASEYNCLVAELGLVAAVEAGAAGHPLSDATWVRLAASVDAAAAVVDVKGAGPRQGDGDDGRALLLDAPDPNHWPSLLALGAGLVGARPWWPDTAPVDVRAVLVGALAGGPKEFPGRADSRPSHFADAGLTLLRSEPQDGPEIWCRCDGGPHGFLSIAAHAHADALSVEVRFDGVEILTDPGTYCYHGEPDWRAYFRSTLAHNTLQLAGEDQSIPGGSFLWSTQAAARILEVGLQTEDGTRSWSGDHDGYERLDPPAVHRRDVRLDSRRRRLQLIDRVFTDGRHRCCLAFHLGPKVEAVLDGSVAELRWPAPGHDEMATLTLPPTFRWTTHQGETSPIAGWYSPGFGRRAPTVALLGKGVMGPDSGSLVSLLQFRLPTAK